MYFFHNQKMMSMRCLWDMIHLIRILYLFVKLINIRTVPFIIDFIFKKLIFEIIQHVTFSQEKNTLEVSYHKIYIITQKRYIYMLYAIIYVNNLETIKQCGLGCNNTILIIWLIVIRACEWTSITTPTTLSMSPTFTECGEIQIQVILSLHA